MTTNSDKTLLSGLSISLFCAFEQFLILYCSLIITNFIITVTYTTLTLLGTVTYVSSHKNPKVDAIAIPISQMKKLRRMEVEEVS